MPVASYVKKDGCLDSMCFSSKESHESTDRKAASQSFLFIFFERLAGDCNRCGCPKLTFELEKTPKVIDPEKEKQTPQKMSGRGGLVEVLFFFGVKLFFAWRALHEKGGIGGPCISHCLRGERENLFRLGGSVFV